MNTKQLWTALTLNVKTNMYFDGVFSYNTLKNIKEKPGLIICNTDPSYKPGEHWVLFFFDSEDSVDFYDSLGKDISYYGDEFLKFILRFAKNITQCEKRTQPINSSLCGQYCLYYAYLKCSKKWNMEKIVNSMTLPENVFNFVKNKFYFSPYYDCSLIQKCIKC